MRIKFYGMRESSSRRLGTVYGLVNACFPPFWWPIALGVLWTNLDFCKPRGILPQSVPWPHGPKGACPHFKEGTHGQHQMITERTEWERVIAAATSVTHGVKGPAHQCRAPCGHAGCPTASSLSMANVSYTYNYPAAGWNISTDSKVSAAEGRTLFHVTPAQHCWVL